MVRLNHHVGPAPMAAVVRLPTISDGAAHLDASCLHAAGKSAQWLFGDSLPTNRQVGIRDLFDFFWSVEQGHMNCRRVYVLDFRPVAAFIRPDATSTAVEWIYHYGPGAVHRPVRDRGWWRCKSSRVPGLSGSASTTSSRRAGCRSGAHSSLTKTPARTPMCSY